MKELSTTCYNVINSFNALYSEICEDLKLDFTTIKQWENFFKKSISNIKRQ